MKPVTVSWDEGALQREAPLQDVDLGRLVASLDGAERTLVTVTRGGAHAACGGAVSSGLVLYVSTANGDFHQLRGKAPSPATGQVWLVAGGQGADWDVEFIVDYDAAMTALSWFAAEGEPIPRADWHRS